MGRPAGSRGGEGTVERREAKLVESMEAVGEGCQCQSRATDWIEFELVESVVDSRMIREISVRKREWEKIRVEQGCLVLSLSCRLERDCMADPRRHWVGERFWWGNRKQQEWTPRGDLHFFGEGVPRGRGGPRRAEAHPITNLAHRLGLLSGTRPNRNGTERDGDVARLNWGL